MSTFHQLPQLLVKARISIQRQDVLLRSNSHHSSFSRYIRPRRPSLGYYLHIKRAAAPSTLSILDAVQRRAIRLIGELAFTCHPHPPSHRRAVGDLSLFYRYLNGFCSSQLISIIPPLAEPARTPAELLLTPRRSFFIHQEPNNTTAPLSPGCLGPGMDCLVMYLLSLQVLAKSHGNKLPLT
nr:unnamed protein product [Callosobruchus chinensis]